ncbi:hypothetical protein FACS1894159_10960 [Bacteroidia bacterium]|nr:hypothetical protein FACS1894159_10960 [Bacteroidia bacterium]
MRAKLHIAAVAALALFAVSCGEVNLTKQESIDKTVSSAIAKYLPQGAAIYQITLLSGGNFKFTANQALVTFTAPDSEQVKCEVYMLDGSYKPRDWTVWSDFKKRTPASGVCLEDVDLSKIAANIDKAAAMLAEAEYKFSGVSRYEINLEADPAQVEHKFTLESKAGTKATIKNGRAGTETSYYTFDFVADADGEVVYVGD